MITVVVVVVVVVAPVCFHAAAACWKLLSLSRCPGEHDTMTRLMTDGQYTDRITAVYIAEGIFTWQNRIAVDGIFDGDK